MEMTRTLLLTVSVLAVPRAVLACPVCFGQSDSPMVAGVNMAVFFMLGVTGSVLAGFAGFIVYLMRRAKLVAAGPYEHTQSESHEGTA